jgi:hypothetical protein
LSEIIFLQQVENKMKYIGFVVTMLFVLSSVALAKPSVVKGAKCTECHEKGKFNKAGLTAKAKEMVEQSTKDNKQCGDCHAAKDGKLVLKDGEKKEAAPAEAEAK